MRRVDEILGKEPKPKPKMECEHCGAKGRCIHRLVPKYQLKSPDLFGEKKL